MDTVQPFSQELSNMVHFLQWPLLACLLLPGLLVYLGLHIIRREIIFVDLALAQVAALGTCVAILVGHHDKFWELPIHILNSEPFKISYAYAWSVSFTIIGAAIFTLTRGHQNKKVPQEALIGIIYVVAAAAGILLLSGSPNGKEELQETLVGDLLHISKPGQVFRPFTLFAVIGLVHYIFRKQFLSLSFEHHDSPKSGLSVKWWDFLFYSLFGLAVTSFVEIGGVLLVFSYLIVPAVCANFLADRLRSMLFIGWIVATVSSAGGLYTSYKFDLPTGAAIVCVFGAILILCGIIARLKPKKTIPGNLSN